MERRGKAKINTITPVWKKAVNDYEQPRPTHKAKQLSIKRTNQQVNHRYNNDMQHLTPPSEEIRLRDDSELDSARRDSGRVRKVRPNVNAIVEPRNAPKKQPFVRKVPLTNNDSYRNKKVVHGHEVLHPSNMRSEFSSCDFHSIDEFSLNKSNIQIRNMDFDKQSSKPKLMPKEESKEIVFNYQPNYRRPNRVRDRALRKNEGNARRVLQIKPQVSEDKVSYIFKEISSYEKSVEMPSSYIEPSIVFDEREGKRGALNQHNVSKYDFKPVFSKRFDKPSLMEHKTTECTQIRPKDNQSDSLISCNMSDVNSTERSTSDLQNASNGKIQSNGYKSKKSEETKEKPKLKDYITQVGQNTDFYESKHKKNGSKTKYPIEVDRADVDEEDLTQAKCKGKDFLDQDVAIKDEQEPESAQNFSDVHKMHMVQTLQGLLFIRSLPEVSQEEIESKKIFLPPPDHPSKTKVLVFDLDETLVHCLEDYDPSEVDHILPIHFPNDEVVEAGLNIRPYAIECLKEANKHFQVIVFTASHSCYADAVLDFIDPGRELIQYRMYRDQ